MKIFVTTIFLICAAIVLVPPQAGFAWQTLEGGCLTTCHSQTQLHPLHAAQVCTVCHPGAAGAKPIPSSNCVVCHPRTGTKGVCPLIFAINATTGQAIHPQTTCLGCHSSLSNCQAPVTTTTSVRPTTTTIRPTTTTIRPTTTTVRPTTTTIRPTTTTIRPTTTTIQPTTTTVRPTTTTVRPTTTTVRPTTTTIRPTTTTIKVTTSTTTSAPPPECVVDADCDDKVFCNGTEKCINGTCVNGKNPCGEEQVCKEGLHQCWNVVSITAASLLRKVVMRPILMDKKCLWLIVYPSQDHHFMPESSSIEITGSVAGAHGVMIDSRQSAVSAGRFIFVPVCIEQGATTGQWNLLIKTAVGDSALEESIITSLEVR